MRDQIKLFFDEAAHEESQNTLIIMTSPLKTLEMTCQDFYSQWRHNQAAPSWAYEQKL